MKSKISIPRKERHLQGKSLAAVAEPAGISVPTLSLFERGLRSVSPDALHRIAQELEVSPDQLVEETSERFDADDVVHEVLGVRLGRRK